MSLPIQVFGDHLQRLPGAIRLRGITWKLLVRQIWVIHKRAGRFHQLDSARIFALCQLRSPSSRVQGLAKVDPGRPPLGVVGGIAGLKQVPRASGPPGCHGRIVASWYRRRMVLGDCSCLSRHLYRGHHSCGNNRKNPPRELVVRLSIQRRTSDAQPLTSATQNAGRVTTQAQRPGPRDAWIATTARWPGSLQRMVRPRS
jgi:hypothetical protein